MTLSVLEVYAAPLGPDYPLGGGGYLHERRVSGVDYVQHDNFKSHL